MPNPMKEALMRKRQGLNINISMDDNKNNEKMGVAPDVNDRQQAGFDKAASIMGGLEKPKNPDADQWDEKKDELALRSGGSFGNPVVDALEALSGSGPEEDGSLTSKVRKKVKEARGKLV